MPILATYNPNGGIKIKASALNQDLGNSFSKFIVEQKDPRFVYAIARAVTADVPNKNWDFFPLEEIQRAYPTFIGRNIFLDHNTASVRNAVGKIIAAELREDEEGHTYVACLFKVDRQIHPDIAMKIENGIIDSVSMGANVMQAECSMCHHVATKEAEFCEHLHNLGRYMDYDHGTQNYSINHGVEFTELSLVSVPADPTAKMHKVFDAHTGMKKQADGEDTSNTSASNQEPDTSYVVDVPQAMQEGRPDADVPTQQTLIIEPENKDTGFFQIDASSTETADLLFNILEAYKDKGIEDINLVGRSIKILFSPKIEDPYSFVGDCVSVFGMAMGHGVQLGEQVTASYNNALHVLASKKNEALDEYFDINNNKFVTGSERYGDVSLKLKFDKQKNPKSVSLLFYLPVRVGETESKAIKDFLTSAFGLPAGKVSARGMGSDTVKDHYFKCTFGKDDLASDLQGEELTKDLVYKSIREGVLSSGLSQFKNGLMSSKGNIDIAKSKKYNNGDGCFFLDNRETAESKEAAQNEQDVLSNLKKAVSDEMYGAEPPTVDTLKHVFQTCADSVKLANKYGIISGLMKEWVADTIDDPAEQFSWNQAIDSARLSIDEMKDPGITQQQEEGVTEAPTASPAQAPEAQQAAKEVVQAIDTAAPKPEELEEVKQKTDNPAVKEIIEEKKEGVPNEKIILNLGVSQFTKAEASKFEEAAKKAITDIGDAVEIKPIDNPKPQNLAFLQQLKEKAAPFVTLQPKGKEFEYLKSVFSKGFDLNSDKTHGADTAAAKFQDLSKFLKEHGIVDEEQLTKALQDAGVQANTKLGFNLLSNAYFTAYPVISLEEKQPESAQQEETTTPTQPTQPAQPEQQSQPADVQKQQENAQEPPVTQQTHHPDAKPEAKTAPVDPAPKAAPASTQQQAAPQTDPNLTKNIIDNVKILIDKVSTSNKDSLPKLPEDILKTLGIEIGKVIKNITNNQTPEAVDANWPAELDTMITDLATKLGAASNIDAVSIVKEAAKPDATVQTKPQLEPNKTEQKEKVSPTQDTEPAEQEEHLEEQPDNSNVYGSFKYKSWSFELENASELKPKKSRWVKVPRLKNKKTKEEVPYTGGAYNTNEYEVTYRLKFVFDSEDDAVARNITYAQTALEAIIGGITPVQDESVVYKATTVSPYYGGSHAKPAVYKMAFSMKAQEDTVYYVVSGGALHSEVSGSGKNFRDCMEQILQDIYVDAHNKDLFGANVNTSSIVHFTTEGFDWSSTELFSKDVPMDPLLGTIKMEPFKLELAKDKVIDFPAMTIATATLEKVMPAENTAQAAVTGKLTKTALETSTYQDFMNNSSANNETTQTTDENTTTDQTQPEGDTTYTQDEQQEDRTAPVYYFSITPTDSHITPLEKKEILFGQIRDFITADLQAELSKWEMQAREDIFEFIKAKVEAHNAQAKQQQQPAAQAAVHKETLLVEGSAFMNFGGSVRKIALLPKLEHKAFFQVGKEVRW